jgi:two-component system sensor histidine kinase KdpD
MIPDPSRPDPNALLNALKKEEERERRGKLKIFFGMCAGVGKTYDMLVAAREARAKGIDVVVGLVETHGRQDTEKLLEGLSVVPRRTVTYRGTTLQEMDIDAILERRPALVLVDELAHTNAPGSRHAKRYQDVEELLDAGIDVFTTLNVQHVESRAETVGQIAGLAVRETVPDSIFAGAEDVEIIDLPPDELLKRLADGKVYNPERSQQAAQNFFRKGTLTALREMALRMTAERVDHQLRDYMRSERIAGPWKSGQRLLVAVSQSPRSATLIRWARRMAYAMNASLITVYVESSRPLSPGAKAELEKNIKLARELGAELVTTSDDDVARALVRVAREQNVSQILLGKPGRALPFGRSLLDRVIAESRDLDVYVVGTADEASAPPRPWFPDLRAGVWQYLAAAAAVFAVTLLCLPLMGWMGYQSVSLLLLLTVALLSLRLGAGPVVAAAALSALAWDFLFIPPRFRFSIALGEDLFMAVAFFAIAAITGTLTARIRAREKAVRQREERVLALYGLTADLAGARGQDEVAAAIVRHFERVFDADVAVCLSDADGEVFTRPHPASTYALDEKEFSVAVWTYWNEKKAGRFTDTLPSASALYVPIAGPRYTLGVVGVRFRRGESLSGDQESLLMNFVSQVASSLEREQLNEIAQQSLAFVRSEELYKTLFNSLSHEFRTPIAAILSASEALDHAGAGTRLADELTGEVRTAAGRLNRLIDNLLDMTRLESGRIAPLLDWCDLRDLVATTVRKIGADLGDRPVSVDIPEEMPLVRLDFVLMEQALTNLLHNASLYTPPGTGIEIRARVDGDACLLVVADRGPGFPPQALAHLFDKFYRVPGSKAGGTGLGLSIAKGFVAAHEGTITAANREGGGAEFILRLPLRAYHDDTKAAT